MLPGNTPSPFEFLKPLARELGFAGIGVAPAGPVPKSAKDAYLRYVSQGLFGNLEYMARHQEQRLDVRHAGIVPGAAAVVSAALPYGCGAIEKGFWKFVAAHARGLDYHRTVREKLAVVAAEIKRLFPESRHRIFVDSSPVMERTWAVVAGVGSLGKNGQVIVPPHGSRVVLGEIVCSSVPVPETLEVEAPFALCEGCTLCLDSCPCGAIISPASVDARRCLSYWSIENRDDTVPLVIGNQMKLVFGCDICAEVCPHDGPGAGTALQPPDFPQSEEFGLTDIARKDDEDISKLIKGTPLDRTGPKVLRRNGRIVLGKKRGMENV